MSDFKKEVKQGTTFKFKVVKKTDCVVVDLTGYVISVAFELSTDNTADVITFDSTGLNANGSTITITPLIGEYVVNMSGTDSALLTVGKTYLFDVKEVTAGGDIENTISGEIIITRPITA